MNKFRRFPSELFVKEKVLRSRGYPFLAPYHVGNSHKMIINHIRHVVCRHTIRLDENLVVNHVIAGLDISAETVFYHAHSPVRCLEPHNKRHPFIHQAPYLGFGKPEAFTVILWILFSCSLFGTHFFKAFGSAETAVCMAICEKLFDVFPINIRPFALTVRAIIAADIGALIPGKTNPAKSF